VKREELLADAEAPRLKADWIVATTASEVQPDKLRRLETWLINAAPAQDAPNVTLLIDFVPVSAGPSASPFTAGEMLKGEVVLYPSAAPLRGQLATREASERGMSWPQLPQVLDAALRAYETALARLPWLERWPLVASQLTVERSAAQQLVLASEDGIALPIERAQTDELLPLVGAGAVSVVATWDGRFARLLAADTTIGRWYTG
jgi:hypothetical protein